MLILKIYWNEQYKYELAYLLFKLKEGNFIRSINTKGYFKIAERYFVNYSGTTYQKNALVKNSSKISKNSNKYIEIIKKVEDVLKVIMQIINELLQDYSK